MDYRQTLMDELSRSGHVTAAFARQQGIPTVYLSRLVDEGVLQRVHRGIYTQPGIAFDDWHLFQLRHGAVVYSHLSALWLHGFTDQIVSRKEVTVYRGYNAHRFVGEDIKVHYVARDVYEMGLEVVISLFGSPLRSYDIERSFCDMVRDRSDYPDEVLAHLIRQYAAYPNKDTQKLGQYAQRLGILPKVQDIVGLML